MSVNQLGHLLTEFHHLNCYVAVISKHSIAAVNRSSLSV